jgi:Tol biopolymer transport system component
MLRTLLAALTAVLIVPATAEAAFPGANGRIAFNWTFGCDGSVIATMKPDGSDLRRLTADPCKVDGAPRAAYPDYSADGASLLFIRGQELYTMTADGAGQAALGLKGLSDTRVSVSPNGERVAFTRVRNGRTTAYTARLDGTDERRLRTGYSPRYSPDGRSIALVTSNRRIVIVRARTGKTVRRLRSFGYEHDWAPGGRRLLFANAEDVYVIRADGTGKPRRVVNSGGELLSAIWSPDGKRVAFVRQLPTNEEEVRFGVFTKRIDGGRARRIYRTSVESGEETLEALTISWQPVVGP